MLPTNNCFVNLIFMSENGSKTKRIKFMEADVGTTAEELAVTCSHVLFSRGNFYIFNCREGISVKGTSSFEIIDGMKLKISGIVGMYGRVFQISADKIEKTEDETNVSTLIAAFIKDTFDGIGSKTALLIAQEYGESFLTELLRRPKSVSDKITGLSEARAKICSAKIDEDFDRLKTLLKLRIFGLSDENSKKAVKEFGFAAYDLISQNPYVLSEIENIGFETCEELAGGLGLEALDINRVACALKYVLSELHYGSGSTWFKPLEVKESVRDLIVNKNVDKFKHEDKNTNFDVAFEQALDLSNKADITVVYKFKDHKCMGCELYDENARISLKNIFKTEAVIKKEVEEFINAQSVAFNDAKAERRIEKLSREIGIVPDEKQKAAIKMCMREPFCIITGGPGTGKTTITGILAEHFRKEKIPCAFCAPTGRAAKRLSEAVKTKAYTIHRLLEVRGDEDGGEMVFGRGSDNPLEARVIIVDEASMVDIFLFKALLYAVAPNSSLIIIGDPNQLPSVGPGSILNDLLSCSAVPRVELEYVFRTENESSIASNSYRILKGEKLIPNDTDFRIFNVDNEEAAISKVGELFTEYRKDISDTGDLAILTPTKQNLCGTGELNFRLQKTSTGDSTEAVTIKSGAVLHPNDKVMQIKNDYAIEYFDIESGEVLSGVYNGEIGVVTEADEDSGSVKVLFDDGKEVFYEKKKTEGLDLAYAMTVHKAQGCEFDTVIICLGKISRKLCNRRLFYTAVTRGKKQVIIVDSSGMCDRMIKAGDSNERNTSLSDFLQIIAYKLNGQTYENS